MTSRREHPRRIAHSCSDCPSRADMTKTKRSNAPSAKIAAKGLFSADVAGSLLRMNGKLSGCSGTGLIIRIAYLRTARRAHERAHSMKTTLPSTHSPIAQTKHCSALSLSAVSRSESRFRRCISSVRVLKKSATVAYDVVLSLTKCIGCSIFTSFVPKSCPVRRLLWISHVPREQSDDPTPRIGLNVRGVNQFYLAQRKGTGVSRQHTARPLLGTTEAYKHVIRRVLYARIWPV